MASDERKQPITLNDVRVIINGEVRGFIQKVTFNTSLNIKKVWEAGNKGNPVSQVQTKRDYNGSFDRTFVDKEILQELAPNNDDFPEFDLQAQPDADPDRTLTIKSCVLKGFPLEIELENETSQSLEFEALGYVWG